MTISGVQHRSRRSGVGYREAYLTASPMITVAVYPQKLWITLWKKIESMG
jgi:hypothetical protein